METKEKSIKGITLVALVITIILMLILAGISIAGIGGENGLIAKTKKAKTLAQIATAKEEVNMAISELITENKGENKDITPKMIAEAVNNNNKRNVTAENDSSFPTNIVYPEDAMGIGEKLFISFINIVGGGGTAYFLPHNSSTGYLLNNCVFGKYAYAMLRTTHGSIKLTNCYGGFTSGYETTDDMWNYQTNYITATPKVDNTTYKITDEDGVWKNVGTGTNPDGSQANLGVYGGKYSWEYDDDIF